MGSGKSFTVTGRLSNRKSSKRLNSRVLNVATLTPNSWGVPKGRSLQRQPAEPPAKPSNGKPAAESVIFRSVDSNGRPAVKPGPSKRNAYSGEDEREFRRMVRGERLDC